MGFHLNIVSLKGQIFSGEVESVTVPAETGRMTVLADHMPIVSPLKMGEIVVKGDKKFNLVIGKGIFTISDNRAELLVEDVITSEDISEVKAREKKKKAEEILEKGSDKDNMTQAKYDLKRSSVELEMARKNNKTTQNS